jgi:transposase-like protein
MPLNQPDQGRNKEQLFSDDIADSPDLDAIIYNDKTKVECICPKCDQKHKINFHWIGRGIPRKYCPSCKGSC